MYTLDCRRLESLLTPGYFDPTPEDLFPRWHRRMRYEQARAAAPPQPEPAARSVAHDTPEEPDEDAELADDTPPGWADIGDAPRAILTVLAKETARREGSWVAGKAGYQHGTLRHHFGPLQGWTYIDRTKDGYAITAAGRALLPPKAV